MLSRLPRALRDTSRAGPRRIALALVVPAVLAALAATPAVASIGFVGTTSQGTAVHFRLYTNTNRVGRFDFGPVTVTCLDGSKRTEPTTTVYFYPLDAKGRFHGADFFTSGNAYELRGRIRRPRASGRLAIPTRDDCFASVTWHAQARR